MFRQVGNLKINRKAIVQRGLIIHLVLPNDITGSRKIIDFVSTGIFADSYINIMDQYHPAISFIACLTRFCFLVSKPFGNKIFCN